MSNDARLMDDLLLMALDDYVHIGDVVGAAMPASGDPQVVRSVALGLGVQALVDGELVAGDLWDAFVPWPMGTPQCVDRLVRDWLAAGWNPMPGQVCWFAITATGTAAAEPAVARAATRDAAGPTERPPRLDEPAGPNPFLGQLLDGCRVGRADLRDVIAIAGAALTDQGIVRDLSIGILAEALVPGTIMAGIENSEGATGSDGTGIPGFEPWPGTGADALCRIVADWPATQPEPAGAARCVLTIG